MRMTFFFGWGEECSSSILEGEEVQESICAWTFGSRKPFWLPPLRFFVWLFAAGFTDYFRFLLKWQRRGGIQWALGGRRVEWSGAD